MDADGAFGGVIGDTGRALEDFRARGTYEAIE